MKLEEALNKMGGPTRGFTSMLSALRGGDLKSVSGGKRAEESLPDARKKLEDYKQAMFNAKSDAAYWGYMGDVSYWTAVVALLEAAEIVGPDNLPDVAYDETPGVVMDMCARQERFGQEVLRLSRDHIPLS